MSLCESIPPLHYISNFIPDVLAMYPEAKEISNIRKFYRHIPVHREVHFELTDNGRDRRGGSGTYGIHGTRLETVNVNAQGIKYTKLLNRDDRNATGGEAEVTMMNNGKKEWQSGEMI